MGEVDVAYFLQLIHQIQPEKNNIIKKYESLLQSNPENKSTINNALQSQSFLQLKNEYCDSNKCLSCAIGNSILKD